MSFNKYLSFNTGLFLIKGKGYYEQYKAAASFTDYGLPNPVYGNDTITSTDLVRQLWLDNNFFGQIFSLQYKKGGDVATLGGAWNRYNGNHYGQIIWAETGIPQNYRWYYLNANKTDVNTYAKWQHSLSPALDLYADLQYRHVSYNMYGFRDHPDVTVERKFDFINPKAGITYSGNGFKTFLSYALSNKEPNRDDFEAGIAQQPKHETLHDFEAGVEKRTTHFSWGATAYYMLYRNQLILTGQINDVGSYTRVNIPHSYRLGIEMQAKATISQFFNATANLALSRNKVKGANEYLDDYDNGGQKMIPHTNTDISFSPAVVAGASLNIIPLKNLTLSLPAKYVSRQYLDNTQDVNRSLQPYYVQDAKLTYSLKNKWFKQVDVSVAVYNIFNKKYEPNGYTFSYIYGGQTTTENYYFPMAGTNFMTGLSLSF